MRNYGFHPLSIQNWKLRNRDLKHELLLLLFSFAGTFQLYG